MTSDSDSSQNDDHAETNSGSADLWLAENYPQYHGIPGLPSEYLKFTIDDPSIVESLSMDLQHMSDLRATACYDNVVDTITGYMGNDPEFEDLIYSPEPQTRQGQEDASLTTFLIGHTLDQRCLQPDGFGDIKPDTQLILDADVAGIIECPSGTLDDELTMLNPDLLEYDYLVLCQAMNGTFYSETAEGSMTTDNLVDHLIGDLSLRRDLLTDDPQFYEAIYTPTLEYLLNEHHDVHY